MGHFLVNESLLLVPILLNWLVHSLGFQTPIDWKKIPL